VWHLLFAQLNIDLNNVMDSQVLYGLLASGKGKPEKRIGLNALLKKYNLNPNTLKETVTQSMDNDKEYWRKRPLTCNSTTLFLLIVFSGTHCLRCWRCEFSFDVIFQAIR
jgi:hypothetical protein